MAYLQNPVTVSKGEHIVKDVYLSDLAAWQEQGYDIYDPSVSTESPITPKKKATKSTPVEPE